MRRFDFLDAILWLSWVFVFWAIVLIIGDYT
jgi:hypothetical protein